MDEEKELEQELQADQPQAEQPQDTAKVQKNKKESKTAGEIAVLKEKIRELEEKALRIRAESINYKKRLQQESEQAQKYSKLDLIQSLMPHIELFHKIVNMDTPDIKLKGFLQGFKMIDGEIFKVLYQDGLKDIPIADQIFDPKYHYAFDKIRDESLADHQIVREVQKGYLYKDRVLQAAKVVINDLSLVNLARAEVEVEDGKVRLVKVYDGELNEAVLDKLELIGREYEPNRLKAQLLTYNYLADENTVIVVNAK
jgi:molecular chaperone GrpE